MIRESEAVGANFGLEPPLVDGANHNSPFGDIERSYLQEIGKFPLLTREEEIFLSRQIRRGLEVVKPIIRPNGQQMQTLDGCDPTTYPLEEAQILEQAMAAKNHITERNLRLVVSIAKRYLGRGMGFLDLVQEGNLGLMHAAESFDPEKGFRFSTYSTWWIRQAVTRALANQGRGIRLPVHVTDRLGKIAGAIKHLEQRSLTGEPPTEEIARELGEGYTPDKVALLGRYASPVLSLDAPNIGDSSATLGDTIEDLSEPPPDDMAERSALKEDVSQVLECLTPRQRLVIEMRYGLKDGTSHTLEKIGQTLGVTRERIRQIEAKALRKLKHPSRSRKLRGYLDET